ncbi:MAG: D-alanyl-D-alanine carboxypeptidase family protein [Candidatus Azambacteria bacterium]|nr:D-alanyl-D-alanine carboxypeptidase family protein [Candidatus Azambacteria bacterium]
MKVALNHALVCSILEKVGGDKIKVLGTLSFEALYRRLNKQEINLIEKFLELDPKFFGFMGEFFGIGEIPKNLVTIKRQMFFLNGRKKYIKNQYLPLPVWVAYWKMNTACVREVGRELLVDSGYRSPACQMLTFLYYFKLYEFNFSKTVESVAFPGYSEHQIDAVDLMTVDGIPQDDGAGFEETPEYEWLLKSANKFGFYLSYPENNGTGIKFEPWHWRYEGA